MLIELLLPILAGILVIVFANSLSRRIGVAGPLGDDRVIGGRLRAVGANAAPPQRFALLPAQFGQE